MSSYRQSGYTIIEVVAVLAISTAMLAFVLNSQYSSNKFTAFSTELDSINGRISQVQAEANSNVTNNRSTVPGATAGTAAHIQVFGKVVEFYGSAGTPAVRQMHVSTLVSYDDSGRVLNPSLGKCDEYIVNLGEGVEWSPPSGVTNQAIIFKTKTASVPASVYAMTNYQQTTTPTTSASCPLAAAPISSSVPSGPIMLLYDNYPNASTIAPVTLNFVLPGTATLTTGRIVVDPNTATLTRSVP